LVCNLLFLLYSHQMPSRRSSQEHALPTIRTALGAECLVDARLDCLHGQRLNLPELVAHGYLDVPLIGLPLTRPLLRTNGPAI
jgi:hypothetical protein